MAIKVSGTSVINDSRQLQNIASLDSTTISTIGANISSGASTIDFSSPQTTLTSSGTYNIPGSIGDDDFITFYIIGGGGSGARDGANPKGGYGGAALILTAKKSTLPSSVTFTIGSGGIYPGSYSNQAGSASTLTINGRTFTAPGGTTGNDSAQRAAGSIFGTTVTGDVELLNPLVNGGRFYINSDEFGPMQNSKFGGGAGGGRTQSQNIFTGGTSTFGGNGGNGSIGGNATDGTVPGGGGGGTTTTGVGDGANGNLRIYY